jgi:transcriptional regulator with XRE-family HTH domain
MSTETNPTSPRAEIRTYTREDHRVVFEMARTKKKEEEQREAFGKRLARLRKLAGYSQRTLAAELGISYRMVAYYEAQTEHAPAHLLPALAEALGITVDQLLGREAVSPRKSPQNRQLLRKLKQVEQLPPRARNAVLEHIDALVAKHRRSA